MNSYTNRAFTLIEIMIVLAIVAILAAIAYPHYLKNKANSEIINPTENQTEVNYQKNAYIVCINGFLFNPQSKTQILDNKGHGIICNEE